MSDSIPGFDNLPQNGRIEVSSGGSEFEWMKFEQRKLYTNAFIVVNGKILLGYKKRGFGVHKYNGFGGKVDVGETSIQAASRELMEEAGIESSLEHAGTLLFLIAGVEWAFHIDIYRANSYTGTPIETEEMHPHWFRIDDANHPDSPPIPFDKMWESDNLWLPLLLKNRNFIARTDYIREGERDVLRKWCIKETSFNTS